MNSLFKSFDTDNKHYLTKLRLEINSLKLVTSKVLSEIENSKDREVLKESPNTSRLALTNSSKIISTEEFYDAVNKYLMALIQYFDSREELQCHFALPVIINSPKFCHLPTLCNMLWRRIETLSKKSRLKNKVSTPTSPKETESVSMCFKSSQTETSSLMYCESCNLSTELIKSLVHLILNAQRKYNVEETNVSKIRERVRYEVFEMSQWGVMKEWTNAVREDIARLLSLTVSTFKKCDQLYQEREAMTQEHNRSETALQNDLDLTRKQLEAEQAQNTYLNQQIENLNTSLARRIKQEKTLLRNIQEYQEKIKLLGESLMLIRDDCKQMKASQKSLRAIIRSKMLSQSRNISDLKDDIAFVMKKTEDYFDETLQKEKIKLIEVQNISDERKNLILHLETNISELQSEKKRLNENLTILTDQKVRQEDELRNIKGKVIELEKLFEESKARVEHNESFTTTPTDKNLKRDPLTDMESQRQINKQKIKVLLRENANLKTTISKLKKIRTENFESRNSMIT